MHCRESEPGSARVVLLLLLPLLLLLRASMNHSTARNRLTSRVGSDCSLTMPGRTTP